MTAKGILLMISFLRIAILIFLSHGITALVAHTEGTEGRVQLVAGWEICLPLNRQLTETRVRWKVSSFCFGWFQVVGEFIVYPSANSINVGDYSVPRR